MPFRIEVSPDRIVVRDVPSGQWIFGSVFVTAGLVVLSIPLVSDAWHGFVLWERLAVLAIGLGNLTGGAWYVWRYAETITTFDRASGGARYVFRRPFSRQPEITEFKVDDVRGVETHQSVDSDGDPMYQLRLWLSGSRVLPLQSQPTHGRERVEAAAAALRSVWPLPETPP